MSIQNIAAIHKELGLTGADTLVLKSVKLVWARLEALRKQAEKDERYEARYRECLAKSLQQARTTMAPMTTEQVINDAKTLWEWLDAEYARLGIAQKEAKRGMPCFQWCEKWLPESYAKYTEAIERMVELPSKTNLASVKMIMGTMLQAYVDKV